MVVPVKAWYKRIKVMVPLCYVLLLILNDTVGLGIDRTTLLDILYAVAILVGAEGVIDWKRLTVLTKETPTLDPVGALYGIDINDYTEEDYKEE